MTFKVVLTVVVYKIFSSAACCLNVIQFSAPSMLMFVFEMEVKYLHLICAYIIIYLNDFFVSQGWG